MSTVVCDFVPNEGQQRFLNCTKKNRLACTGVGGGKSAVGAVEAACLTHDNGNVPGMIISPTYDMLRLNTVPPIKKFWPEGLIKNPKALNTKNGPFQIEAWNGAPIYFRSASDPDSLRGPNLGWVWWDEPGMCERYAWDVIMGRIRVPCARPGCILTTTPRGYTWLYDVFIEDPPSDEYAMIHWNPRENEPNLVPHFYDELLKSLPPLLAEQEVGGKFVNVNAEAYLNYPLLMKAERDSLPMFPKDDLPLYIGVDVGRKHDITVITVLFRQGDTYYVGALKRLKNVPYDVQQAVISSYMTRAVSCCIDCTGMGHALYERLYYEHGSVVIGVPFSPKSKMEMAARMRTMFEKGQLRIPKETKLRNSLLSVEANVTQLGQITLNASRHEDGHADEFWSLALACQAIGMEPSEILLAII